MTPNWPVKWTLHRGHDFMGWPSDRSCRVAEPSPAMWGFLGAVSRLVKFALGILADGVRALLGLVALAPDLIVTLLEPSVGVRSL
jgi:hypothetical protein